MNNSTVENCKYDSLLSFVIFLNILPLEKTVDQFHFLFFFSFYIQK